MSNRANPQAAQDDSAQDTQANAGVPQGGRRREANWGAIVRNVLLSLAAVAVLLVAGVHLWSWFTSPRAAVQPQNVQQQQPVPTGLVQQGGNVLSTTSAGNTSVTAQVGTPNVLPGPGGSTSTTIVTDKAVEAGYTHYFGPAGKMGNNTTIVVPSACKIPEPQVNVTLPPITVDLTVPPVQAAPVQQPVAPTIPTPPTTPAVPAAPTPAPAVNPAPAIPAPAAAKTTNVQQAPSTQVVVGYNCHGQPVYGPRPWSK